MALTDRILSKTINGVIESSNRCFICDSSINWSAPINPKAPSIIRAGAQPARIEVPRAGMLVGGKNVADVDIIVECPKCNITNRFQNILYYQ